uniref:Uncharacterized protein n=1 Tax=Mycena chlorophos TaxID=658473 RepID=A0ABQ0LBP8_MYCCL|nr:predicted protein [Mycena chlorophos]
MRVAKAPKAPTRNVAPKIRAKRLRAANVATVALSPKTRQQHRAQAARAQATRNRSPSPPLSRLSKPPSSPAAEESRAETPSDEAEVVAALTAQTPLTPRQSSTPTAEDIFPMDVDKTPMDVDEDSDVESVVELNADPGPPQRCWSTILALAREEARHADHEFKAQTRRTVGGFETDAQWYQSIADRDELSQKRTARHKEASGEMLEIHKKTFELKLKVLRLRRRAHLPQLSQMNFSRIVGLAESIQRGLTNAKFEAQHTLWCVGTVWNTFEHAYEILKLEWVHSRARQLYAAQRKTGRVSRVAKLHGRNATRAHALMVRAHRGTWAVNFVHAWMRADVELLVEGERAATENVRQAWEAYANSLLSLALLGPAFAVVVSSSS